MCLLLSWKWLLLSKASNWGPMNKSISSSYMNGHFVCTMYSCSRVYLNIVLPQNSVVLTFQIPNQTWKNKMQLLVVYGSVITLLLTLKDATTIFCPMKILGEKKRSSIVVWLQMSAFGFLNQWFMWYQNCGWFVRSLVSPLRTRSPLMKVVTKTCFDYWINKCILCFYNEQWIHLLNTFQPQSPLKVNVETF